MLGQFKEKCGQFNSDQFNSCNSKSGEKGPNKTRRFIRPILTKYRHNRHNSKALVALLPTAPSICASWMVWFHSWGCFTKAQFIELRRLAIFPAPEEASLWFKWDHRSQMRLSRWVKKCSKSENCVVIKKPWVSEGRLYAPQVSYL